MNVYQTIYDIINMHVFGGVTLNGTQALAVDLVSTWGSLALAFLPVIALLCIIRMLFFRNV